MITTARKPQQAKRPIAQRNPRGCIRQRRSRWLYLLSLLALAGCKPAPPIVDKLPPADALIVFLGPSAHDPQWPAMVSGARHFVSEHTPFRFEALAPEKRLANFAPFLEEVMKRRPAAICAWSTDLPQARLVIDRLRGSETVLITIGVYVEDAAVHGHVDVDPADAAELLGEKLDLVTAGRQSYLLLHGDGVDQGAARTYRRFLQQAREHYALTKLEERSVGNDPPVDVVRAMIDKFPRAGVFITLDPAPWLATPPAELLGQDMRFATLGAAPALWPELRAGRATALVGPLDGEVGRTAIELAQRAMTEPLRSNVLRVIPPELVTADTLDDFAQRYTQAAGMEEPAASRPRP